MTDLNFLEFIKQYDNGNWLSNLIISIFIILSGVVIHAVFFRLLRRITSTTDKVLLKSIRSKFRNPSLLFLLTLAFEIIFLTFAPEHIIFRYFKHFLNLVLIFAITWIIVRFISLGKDIILLRYNIQQQDNLKARRVYTQFRIIERLLKFIIYLIAIAVAFMTFEGIRKIGLSMFASAGVLGIILGFAGQKLIGTFLAGFQIAITQPIRLDDVVIVENEWGWIEEITLTYVVIRIWDKRRLIVPTTYFIEKPFENWTRVSSDILGTVFIYADYNIPFEAIREELTRILASDKHWDGKVNVLQITNTTEKTVEMRALVSAGNSPDAWDLRVNVREKLIEFIKMNYPDCLPRSRISLKNHENYNSG